MSVEIFNFDEGYAVFSKSNYQTRKHAHYLIEIVYSISGTFSITTGEGAFTGLMNAVLPPNVPHDFSCLEASCVLLFIDPLSAMGRYVVQQFQLQSNSLVINDFSLNQFYKDGEVNISLIKEVAASFASEGLDNRIMQCVATIDGLAHTNRLTLTHLSQTTCLSEGRLSHLFKQQLGISVHQYILWKRLKMAILKSREGWSLTACAHHVGFSDSSHFTRVFYKMFGIKPFFVLKS